MVDREPIRDDEVAELANSILSIAHKLSQRTSESRNVIALNGTEVEVMRAIHLHPGLSATEVAARTGLQRSNVSAALRVLEAHRLVTKERSTHDGRAVVLVATPAAIENLDRVREGWSARLRQAGVDVIAECVAVRDILRLLAGRLEVPMLSKVIAPSEQEQAETTAS